MADTQELSLEKVYEALDANRDLRGAVSLKNLLQFIRLSSSLRQDILFAQLPSYSPDIAPGILPEPVCDFLSRALSLQARYVQDLWEILGDYIWDSRESHDELLARDRALFYQGNSQGLAMHSLYPPTNVCINPLCSGQTKLLRLRDSESARAETRRMVILFTVNGAIPTRHVKLHCPDCNSWYHHNFYVHASTRVYYGGVPNMIEVTKHHFVERRVLELITSALLISWTSAVNAATIYNIALSKPQHEATPMVPTDWDPNFNFKLRTEHVWDGLTIFWLLEDCMRRNHILRVPHNSDATNRFAAAIRLRNQLFEREGQPEWSHYCEKCVRFFETNTGLEKVQVLISDGIEMGSPCCGVMHCDEPLVSHTARFCVGHNHLHKECALVECKNMVEPSFLTCQEPEHRALENKYNARRGSTYQLSRRTTSTRDKSSVPADEVDVPDDVNGVVEEVICPAVKNPEGNTTIKAIFSHRRSHNEQLFVRPCGIIIARATFFGSESITQVADMLRKVFRVPGSMPDIFIYDNCCSLYSHFQAHNDPLLKVMGTAVDVFHFNCKHSAKDVVCQEHCNPKLYPELVNSDGTWYFNSSKCEQINSWLGGYRKIIREMGRDRFIFLMDELIRRKNLVTLETLKEGGHIPSYIPGLVHDDHESV